MIDINKYHQLNNTQDRISYLRALAINTLINEAISVFEANEDAILNGTFGVSLLDKSKYEAQINDIIKISIEKIYESREVLDKEISGYSVISKLLDTYINAVNNSVEGKASNYDKLIIKILPKTINFEEDDLYLRLLNVCHHVSLFSDSQAILTYRKFLGKHD